MGGYPHRQLLRPLHRLGLLTIWDGGGIDTCDLSNDAGGDGVLLAGLAPARIGLSDLVLFG